MLYFVSFKKITLIYHCSIDKNYKIQKFSIFLSRFDFFFTISLIKLNYYNNLHDMFLQSALVSHPIYTCYQLKA